ncbi:MAG: DEAD/DEAH box helicase [Clostridiales bacterium]|jgi:ATP-dependent Lhr-like helicase|nr:DEAD/DEAH box helicase [Clostridiales bacterium]
MNAFEKLAPFIQDYIYRDNWKELREVQVAACDVIFNTDSNLLIATPTASGKTEAAFLPVITELYNKPSNSVGVLYIAPLKALINDQFVRIEKLLEEAYIPVTKWHGDSSQSLKNKLLKDPKGIVQTTPESLEAMLMKSSQRIIKLFSDLRFIIIDEAHNFIGEDRGVQLVSVLERLQNLIGLIPRRIGLSATLGDITVAEDWLNSGTKRACVTPSVKT